MDLQWNCCLLKDEIDERVNKGERSKRNYLREEQMEKWNCLIRRTRIVIVKGKKE